MTIRHFALLASLLCAPLVSCSLSDDSKSSTAIVIKVVDGDTIWVQFDDLSKEKVRLIGIDTPEKGKCGFDEATHTLTELVLNQKISLVEGGISNRDRYKRLLRYVEIGRVDAGLELIKKGLGIHRYDSTDEFPKHDREESYIAADDLATNYC